MQAPETFPLMLAGPEVLSLGLRYKHRGILIMCCQLGRVDILAKWMMIFTLPVFMGLIGCSTTQEKKIQRAHTKCSDDIDN
jgi:hypothetical protein